MVESVLGLGWITTESSFPPSNTAIRPVIPAGPPASPLGRTAWRRRRATYQAMPCKRGPCSSLCASADPDDACRTQPGRPGPCCYCAVCGDEGMKPTLRQTCPRPKPRAQFAFKDSMVHGILQFTLRIAFRCVLHRYGSQDIRC